MSRITIYHPSKYLGGTEILFSRVIELLVARGYQEINVIDFEDGILSTKLRNDRVCYHDITHFDGKHVLEGATLIASARNIARVLLDCKAHSIVEIKPFFWLLHPSELYSGYCIGSTALKRKGYQCLRTYIRILPAFKTYKKIIQQLDNNQNLWIMDGACKKESEWAFNYQFRKNIVLPLITNLEYQPLDAVPPGGRKFLVLSRLDDFKTHGILKFIEDVIEYNRVISGEKITVSIAGDGPARKMMEDKFFGRQDIKVEFLGYVNNSDLSQLFCDGHFSMLFAMGTSALEGISRGIPTVLLPCTDKAIEKRNDVYKFLHLSDEFTLGEYINTPFESDGYLTFEQIVLIYYKNELDLVSQSSVYFQRSFGKAITQDNLLNVVLNSNSVLVSELKTSKIFSAYTKFISGKRLRSGV
ncbi:glycosyltransferase family 4 protein [Enterobacter sp. Cy-643]|uniref:glycosyltransferase family 4 protein n=1 Tax=Enterobacter sp. Cy-643 TaxID=2608346 RepID=UPI001422D4DB|nr:glycosyltransferase family 4 protein [Enterobacter sp. Cy-643]NIF31120.1 glycosyltransferase family 4 protein [Enterobacter sp. Cy-643]